MIRVLFVCHDREINGREYDFCVMAENMGVLIIEVKGWDPDKIQVNGVDNIVVDGYDEIQTSPKKQARAYRFRLKKNVQSQDFGCKVVFNQNATGRKGCKYNQDCAWGSSPGISNGG